jgi:glycerol-3-phosphate dehydrogenase
MPEAVVNETNVLYTLAGVRPLPRLPGREPGEITRKHMIHDHEEDNGFKGLVTIIGGKLTTFRSLAEQTVDWIGEKIGRETTPSHSEEEALWGGGMSDFGAYKDAEVPWACGEYEIKPETAANLVDLYGTKYRRVLALTDGEPALRQPICEHHADLRAQIVYAAKHELARTLSDVYLRRTGIGTSDCRGLDCAEEGARTLGEHFGWSQKRTRDEVHRYQEEIDLLFSVDEGSSNGTIR